MSFVAVSSPLGTILPFACARVYFLAWHQHLGLVHSETSVCTVSINSLNIGLLLLKSSYVFNLAVISLATIFIPLGVPLGSVCLPGLRSLHLRWVHRLPSSCALSNINSAVVLGYLFSKIFIDFSSLSCVHFSRNLDFDAQDILSLLLHCVVNIQSETINVCPSDFCFSTCIRSSAQWKDWSALAKKVDSSWNIRTIGRSLLNGVLTWIQFFH